MRQITRPTKPTTSEKTLLATVREAKKLSQRELAELSGVHYVTIANLESTPGAVPRANLETLTKLAAALAVSVAELLPRAKVGGGRRC